MDQKFATECGLERLAPTAGPRAVGARVERSATQAEYLLRTTACGPLFKEPVAALLPGKKYAGTPFFVRAISATWNTDRFEIQMSDNGDLWVGGAALSRRNVPIERRAIVVWLDRAPKEVYVTFGIYE